MIRIAKFLHLICFQVHLQTLELGDCTSAPSSLFKTLSDLTRLQRLRLERGAASENVGKLANAPRLQQLELVDFSIGVGFKAGLKVAKNIKKLLIIPTYQVILKAKVNNFPIAHQLVIWSL